MMPFSVLRIWSTGIFSWLLLGGAIYCLWEWSERREAALSERALAAFEDPVVADQGPAARVDGAAREAAIDRHLNAARRYLIAGLALLAACAFGFLPVTLLLSWPGLKDPKSERSGDQRFIERPDGSRLYVELHGPQKAPMIIFTHGWSLDSTAWYYVKHELTRRYRIVVWDLPGLGRSTGPASGNYRIEKMADDLGAVIEAMGRGPVILVGHSIGGMITQTYCRLYPRQLGERVAGLVLLHTTYTNPLRTAILAPLWTALEKPLIVPLNYLTIWLAPLAWLSNWQSYFNGSMQMITRVASFSGRQSWRQLDYAAWLAAKAWPGVLARGNLAMLDFHEELTLPDIEVPTLVLAGAHDRMTKPEASAHMEKKLPHGLPATIRGGHLGFWERHEEIAALITEFAQSVAAMPSNATPNTAAPNTAAPNAAAPNAASSVAKAPTLHQ